MELTKVGKHTLFLGDPINFSYSSSSVQSLIYSSFSGKKGNYEGDKSYDKYGLQYAFKVATGFPSSGTYPNISAFVLLKDHINSNTLAIDTSIMNFNTYYLSKNTNSLSFINPYIEHSITFKNKTTSNQEVKGLALVSNYTSETFGYKPDGSSDRDVYIFPVYLYENFDVPVVFEPSETKTFNIKLALPSQS